MQFLRMGFQVEQSGARLSSGFGGEERNQYFARLQVATRSERAGGDGLSQFVRGTQNYFGPTAELTLDCILDLPRQGGRRFLFRPEDDVATLYVSARTLELKRFAQGAQGFHVDLIVTADVDAPEHGDEYGHDRGSIPSKG